MTAFDRVKILAEKNKISIVELEEKLNFSRNSLYSWKKSRPSADKLEAVADYFNVSTDYLLGRSDSPTSSPSDIPDYEKELLMMFRKGEHEVPEERRDVYRKQVTELMGFISKTMQELDEKNK